MVNYDRFSLALSTLDGAQWRIFEKLAQVFVADEYPSLRPLATMSGDGGFDGALFRLEDDPSIAVQYSVRRDWRAKITETCSRLKETSAGIGVLVYLTNQSIGAAAVKVKRETREKFGIFVDIRDREWFLTQRNASASTAAEAEEFSTKVADPQLTDSTAIARQARALDDLEAKAAFVYLGLQWQDDMRDKGLTKLCFEAITRAILRNTTSDSRMSRVEIHEHARKLLPAHHSPARLAQVNSALARLSKVHIRHWKKPDEFCLTWEERVRLANRLAQMETLDGSLNRALEQVLTTTAAESGYPLSDDDLASIVLRTRGVLERVLLDRGEAFASAVTHDKGAFVRFEDIEAVVYKDLIVTKPSASFEPRLVAGAIQSLLAAPTVEVRVYLRSLADTYTLFAFMRETPDVQSAVVKIFADGDIWLDTSATLPLLAEELLDSPNRNHSLLVSAVRECGLRLYVTEGVVEELTTHVQRCRSYYKALTQSTAYGNEPFLLASYRISGQNTADFEQWLETFCGRRNPEDDMVDYLEKVHGIEVSNLLEYSGSADEALRATVNEIWQEARDQRDRRAEILGIPPLDAATRAKLVQHDVENYLGIVVRRQQRNERRSAFGYRSWWLTLDGTAFRAHREIADRLGIRPPASPAISPDFMVHYLAIGPARMRLSRRTEEALPLMMNMHILDAVPKELLELADELRKELVGLPPHVVHRKIKETLEDARVLLGPIARDGVNALTDDVRRRLVEQAKVR